MNISGLHSYLCAEVKSERVIEKGSIKVRTYNTTKMGVKKITHITHISSTASNMEI